MKSLERSLRFLISSNLFIAACAVLMAQQTGRLLTGNDTSTELLRFIFFATLCSYSFHYYFTTPSLLPSPRIRWIRENKPVLVFLFMAGLAGSVFFFFRLRAWALWLLPAAAATFLYSAPRIPLPLFQWLKKIAFGKTFFLAFTWMYVTVVLPLVVSGAAWKNDFTLYATGRYFFIGCICILFDYRDREDDRIQGVRSLVTYLSRKQITVLFLFSCLSSLVLTLLLAGRGFSRSDLVMLLIPGIILLGIFKYAMQHFSDFLYYVVLDGLLALSAVLMLVARI